jgi:hypothetical protein
MTTPKIQALGITQEWWGTSWKARGYVEGVGWLEARGTSLVEAMEALQALAAPASSRAGRAGLDVLTIHPPSTPGDVSGGRSTLSERPWADARA